MKSQGKQMPPIWRDWYDRQTDTETHTLPEQKPWAKISGLGERDQNWAWWMAGGSVRTNSRGTSSWDKGWGAHFPEFYLGTSPRSSHWRSEKNLLLLPAREREREPFRNRAERLFSTRSALWRNYFTRADPAEVLLVPNWPGEIEKRRKVMD